MITLCVSHRKIENVDSKTMSKQCQNKKKTSSNEEFINQVH